jgi:uncharacterized membrane protein YidH (DUF202 family)
LKEKLKTLEGLADRQNQANSAWIRQILTLASGGLALVVAFHPDAPNNEIEKYLLVVTWISLGTGILSGAAAAYTEVSLARNLVYQYQEELQKILRERIDRPMPTVVGAPSIICLISRRVMVSSLLVSVVSLVGYAVLRTLHT